jgi:hypothetical protein
MEIEVMMREVYGNSMFYPACEKAAKFAYLCGTKTLTYEALKAIKELGYTVNIKQKEIKL